MIKQSINKIVETWKRIVLILVKIHRSCYPIVVASTKRWLQIVTFSLVHACFSSHQEVKFMVFALNPGGPVTVLNNTMQRSTFQRLLSVSKHYKSPKASASFLSRHLLKPRCLAMRSPSHREGLCICALAKSFKLLIGSQHQLRISQEREPFEALQLYVALRRLKSWQTTGEAEDHPI